MKLIKKLYKALQDPIFYLTSIF